ncbi:MAG: MgtC/SapB family protein [Treponemataceae bacterium]
MNNTFWVEIFPELLKQDFPHFISITMKIVISFFAGLVLGIERKIRQQPIGMRTLILICVASTLLMILSIYLGDTYGGDRSRLAAQAVSGIGFLGGGAIIRQGLNVRGLNSSATIWGTSAIGLAIGAGLYVASAVALLFFLFALTFLDRVENKYFPQDRTKRLLLTFNNRDIDYNRLHKKVEKHGLVILSSDIDHRIEEGKIEIIFSVRAPEETDVIKLGDDLLQFGNLEEINLSV